ncbi:MAG: lysophospholipid acyltransferase family protein [Synergistaceae bacterium]
MIRPGWRATALFYLLFIPVRFIAPRKKVAQKNIELVFPDKTDAEKKKMLDGSYRSMIWTGIEMLSWQRDPSLVDKWIVEIEGREHMDQAFALDRGVIVVSAHCGNWEHAAAWLGRNCKGVAVVRHSDDPFQRELIDTLRQNGGLRTLGKDEPMTRAVGILRKNELIGLAADQHGGGDGIMVPFFGHETSTFQGAAVFAWISGAPILPYQCIRIEPFRFKLVINPPIKWEKGKDREATLRSLTAKVNMELEKIIRRAPEQYLWQHKRFKELFSG